MHNNKNINNKLKEAYQKVRAERLRGEDFHSKFQS